MKNNPNFQNMRYQPNAIPIYPTYIFFQQPMGPKPGMIPQPFLQNVNQARPNYVPQQPNPNPQQVQKVNNISPYPQQVQKVNNIPPNPQQVQKVNNISPNPQPIPQRVASPIKQTKLHYTPENIPKSTSITFGDEITIQKPEAELLLFPFNFEKPLTIADSINAFKQKVHFNDSCMINADKSQSNEKISHFSNYFQIQRDYHKMDEFKNDVAMACDLIDSEN